MEVDGTEYDTTAVNQLDDDKRTTINDDKRDRSNIGNLGKHN